MPGVMLSKARIKFIKSLQIKKYRLQEQCFIVEGRKSVLELLGSDFQIDSVYVTPQFQADNEHRLKYIAGEVVLVKAAELESLGPYENNDAALAVVRMKANERIDVLPDEFALVLDDIRDPGNLGTIIRTADWYGIKKVIASPTTADFYNPKVIHSSMGSFARVQVYYTNLMEYLSTVSGMVAGTFLSGENVHQVKWERGGHIIIGNEAHGISPEVEAMVTQRITIPKFGSAESLNAAAAVAVVCDNLRRVIPVKPD